jgi:hypothetical protein
VITGVGSVLLTIEEVASLPERLDIIDILINLQIDTQILQQI